MKRVKKAPRNMGHRAQLAALSIAIFVVFAAISYYFYSQLRHAQLGLIDDHEVIRFLGATGVVRLEDVPKILYTQTEVGQWGHALRLRPVYYLLRILEASLWGDRAGLWYLTRTFAVAGVGAGAAFVVLRALYRRTLSASRAIIAIVFAVVVGGLALTLAAWSDIATRLGPSEVYVGVGLVVLAIGATEAYLRPESMLGWILLFVGIVIVAGSKEDGVLLIVPVAIIYWLRFGRVRRQWMVATLGFLGLAFTLYIAIGVGLATFHAGADMYGNGRSLLGFNDALARDYYLNATFAFFLVALAWDVLHRPRAAVPVGATDTSRPVSFLLRNKLTLAAATCLYLVLGDAFFYQNYILMDGGFSPARYAFLSQVATLGGFVVILMIVTRLPALEWRMRTIIAIALVAVIVISPLDANIAWAVRARVTSAALSQASQDIHDEIRAGVTDIAQHPGAQVILLADHPFDYERVFALPQFLAFYGAANPVFVVADIPYSVSSSTPQYADLSSQLVDMANAGKMDSGWRITPSSRRDANAYTVCFSFDSPRANPACSSVHRIG